MIAIEFDAGFEINRLEALSNQCLTGYSVNGRAIFMCSEEEGICESGWIIDDDGMTIVRDTMYLMFCMPLLEILANYRRQHKA